MSTFAQRIAGPDAVVLSLGGLLALVCGIAAQRSTVLPFAILFGAILIVALCTVHPRYLVTGILCYVPFETLVASAVHGRATVVPLYAAEVASLFVFLRLLVTSRWQPGRRLGAIGLTLAFMSAIWIIAGVWGGRTPYSMLVGYRAELRFLPLLFIPLYSATPLRDARLMGRAIVFVATLQASIAAAEIVGVTVVRRFVQHDSSAVLGGVLIKYGTRTDAIASTFRSYNDLSSFLVLGWIVLLCAGSRELGIRKSVMLGIAFFIPAVVVASGSREGTFALVAAGIVILSRRYRMPAFTLAIIALLLSILAIPYLVQQTTPATPTGAVGTKSTGSGDTSQLAGRWSLLLDPHTWSGQANSHNFRLYLALSEFKLVAGNHPLTGYGLGAVTDKRLASEGRSPLDLITAGRQAIADNYAFDGLWPLMLVEVGLVGLAATFAFLGSIALMGYRLMRIHWLGLTVVTEVLIIFILGFFGGDLQQHITGAVLWASAGYAVSIGCASSWRAAPATATPRTDVV